MWSERQLTLPWTPAGLWGSWSPGDEQLLTILGLCGPSDMLTMLWLSDQVLGQMLYLPTFLRSCSAL